MKAHNRFCAFMITENERVKEHKNVPTAEKTFIHERLLHHTTLKPLRISGVRQYDQNIT